MPDLARSTSEMLEELWTKQAKSLVKVVRDATRKSAGGPLGGGAENQRGGGWTFLVKIPFRITV